MKAFLGTDNTDYIRMYLSIMYSSYISDVDHIYQEINDPAISIHVKLASLVIHTEQVKKLVDENRGQNNYLRQINKYFSELYEQQNGTSRCDYVFFIVNKGLNAKVLGTAYMGSVCKSSHFSSLILNSFRSRLDQTLAHELAHSLGAVHDNQRSHSEQRLEAEL